MLYKIIFQLFCISEMLVSVFDFFDFKGAVTNHLGSLVKVLKRIHKLGLCLALGVREDLVDDGDVGGDEVRLFFFFGFHNEIHYAHPAPDYKFILNYFTTNSSH